ncbi:ATP-dependent helicase [Candidatus Parcubacteria bacterium]|nr:ATP-dependent helicase [Candidatus Parcubacteria bacterium]
MNLAVEGNNIDNHVDEELYNCLNFDNPKSFFLFAGAGSGKTRSLVNVLSRLRNEKGEYLKVNRQQVAIITYTNAACDEIQHRLENDSIFYVSTIHSFIWNLIKNYNADIKEWLKTNLEDEILKLKDQQAKSRGVTKTSIAREKKIETKTMRLDNLNEISHFIYNPNGDNIARDSLNHNEVINIGAYFLLNKPLMQKILVRKYPILLIDESQDTKKELIDAFFVVQKINQKYFLLGLFGDTMQRIYSDGKENLDQNLPKNWIKPVKKMNHRCAKRIITLINKIRSSVDNQEQLPRIEKEKGVVRFFIISQNLPNKAEIENIVIKKMATITKDKLWSGNDCDIKILTLEHHMAARRMGFTELFEPLYKINKLKTGLLDGTLPGIRFFTQFIVPLIKAKQNNDEFSVARIVKKYSPLFGDRSLQVKAIKQANASVISLFSLWDSKSDPELIEILQNISKSGLFPIPESLIPIATRNKKEQGIAEEYKITDKSESKEEVRDKDEMIDAWDDALLSTFMQIEAYDEYISDRAKFGTHQGVKGLEFPRVMVILDDEEAGGFMFSYDKLLGTKIPTVTDKKNVEEGKETSIDRTKRLFYVACSRAEKSLAIVNYSANPELVKANILKDDWFDEKEIEIIT